MEGASVAIGKQKENGNTSSHLDNKISFKCIILPNITNDLISFRIYIITIKHAIKAQGQQQQRVERRGESVSWMKEEGKVEERKRG